MFDALGDSGPERHAARKTELETSTDPAGDLRAGWDARLAFAEQHAALYRLMLAPRPWASSRAGDGVTALSPRQSGKEAFEETEVATGDALDGCDCLSVGEVVRVASPAQGFPMAPEDEAEFVSAEDAAVAGEAESAVELWGAAEALADSGHADEDQDVGVRGREGTRARWA